MERKRILIVSKSFFPANSPRSFRTTELAKELAAQGQTVTVITPRLEPFHSDFERAHHIKIKDMGETRWKGVKLSEKGVKRLFTRGVARLSNLLFLYPEIELMFLVKRIIELEQEKYDLLITIAAPHSVHWGTALGLRKNANIAKKWIADCGDPFMGGENDTFKRMFYFKYLEKLFCRKADFITVPIPDAISAYYPEFRDKIRVIPQGFKFEDVEIISDSVANPTPTFAYAGSLIPGIRDPREFFEFICKTDLPYKFVIYTKNSAYAKKYEAASGGRVEVRDVIPRAQLLKELQRMDFVVNFENKGAKQSPSKLIDYAIISKPILSVKTFGFSSENLLEFLSGNYINQLVIQNPDQYRIENVAGKFLILE